MDWITRERPKIDRLACPWLIKKFVDQDANFIFAPYHQVLQKSRDLNAVPFDIPEVEYTHYGEESTFDYILKKHGLKEPALARIATIVRGADTDRYELAPEAAGLWAISVGMAYNIKEDQELLKMGFVLYDALYSWATYLVKVKHLENSPFEKLLYVVYNKFLKSKTKDTKKPPKWTKELKKIIQDQIDSQFTFDLKQISHELDLNPSYISREFSKYFEDMNFGEYIRSKRIQKSISLFESPSYSLTEIAYLTGFSDQSHFTRVFKQTMGQTPSSYRKRLLKGKVSTKSK